MDMKNIQLVYPAKPKKSNIYSFTIRNVNVSIINAIRRTILTNIETVVFKTFPDKQNQATFEINTTRLNNEILKQRLGCIPIHITDIDAPLDDLIVEISKKNETNAIQYITSGDFRIKNMKTGKYHSESAREKIFPKNKKTGDYILFARLRPKISEHIPGEQLKITAKMSVSSAKEDGMYNVASTCSYQMTPDPQKQRDAWEAEEDELQKRHILAKEIEVLKKNWYNHTAKRHYKPNTFDFILETIGVFTNTTILLKACDSLIQKLNINEFPIQKSISTIKNCYDITLENEDYTIGCVIEYILNEDYYKKKHLTYVGFQKKHPHDTFSIIRIAFKHATTEDSITTLLTAVCKRGIAIYESIKSQIQ